jgi:hypothetical protein
LLGVSDQPFECGPAGGVDHRRELGDLALP